MGVGRKADVIVIGAGIIGAACAWRLAREGIASRWWTIAAPAPAAGMGHLVCMDDNPAELALSAYSLRLWREVTGCMPQACAWRGCGTLWLADKVDEMAIAEQNGRGWRSWGSRGTADGGADRRRGADAAARSGRGLRVPGDAAFCMRRSRLAGCWPTVARRSTWCMAKHQRWKRGRAAGGRQAPGCAYSGPACGLRANSLLPQTLLHAKKGHLAITDRYPPRVRHQLVELGYGASAHASGGTSVAFNVQARPTGQWLIGSSRQFDAVDSALDMPVLAAMLTRAQHFCPCWRR